MQNAGRVLNLDLLNLKQVSWNKLNEGYAKVTETMLQRLNMAIENDDTEEVIACDAILNQYLHVNVEQYLDGEEFSAPRVMENLNVAALRVKACDNVERNFERDLDRRITEVEGAVSRRDRGKLKMLSSILDTQFGVKLDSVLKPVERTIVNALLLGA